MDSSSPQSNRGMTPAELKPGGRGRNMAEVVAKGIVNSFVLALSMTIFLVFVIGSFDFFKNVEKNKCEMTFMFEYPEFIPIKLGTDIDKKYPLYGLYAYAEGQHVAPAVKQKFTGIPVLFIPGNAGSYKQVRSFASVALRKWLDSKTPFHFDFFSLDFNEELSGLYGYVLQTQSQYLLSAIEKIQSFYPEYHSVILIGHSMGGIVAKSLKEHNEPLSHLIISLSTPHSRPILVLDPEQDLFYYYLSRNWTNTDDKFRKDVTIVSVAGGDRDFLVPEGFTKWGKHLDVHTTTTSVPGVWASTDHLCIVWCKQFVMSLVRALFDMVEWRKQNGFYALNQDPQERLDILNYHLVQKSSGKSYHGAHRDLELPKPPTVTWNELLVHNFCFPGSRSSTYLMFPMQIIQEKIKSDPEDYRIVVLTTNTDPKNWIFGCTSQTITEGVRYCSAAENLSSQGQLIPHFRRRRKVIHLKYMEISKFSHLIVKMDAFHLKSCVNLEVYNENERSKQVRKFETQHKIFYNLSLPVDTGIFAKLFAWSISAYTNDSAIGCEGSYNSLGVFQHGKFAINRFLKNESIIARFSDWNATSASVQLYLEPTCKYEIQVRWAYVETAGQIFRTYSRLLPSFFGSIVLMSLYFQRDAKDWSNFHRVLISNAYHLTIVPGLITSFMLMILPNDWPHMLDGPEYFVVLPMFCYLVAYSLVLAVASGVWYLIITSGNVVHAVFLKLITTRFFKWTNLHSPIPMPNEVTDIAMNFTFAKFPFLISVFLISLTLGTCGAFGLVAGICFFIIKLFKMYEDILGDLWRGRIQNVSEGLSPLNFHFSCAMIWFLITLVNIPSLIHWVKSFSLENPTQWDLSMYLCLMLLPTIAVLWQGYVPKFNPLLWQVHRFVFYFMGLALVIWGTFRLYILGFILTLVLITTAMCQLISSLPFVTDEEIPLVQEQQQTVTPVVTNENNVDDVSGSESESESGSEASEEEDSLAEEFPELRPSYKNILRREKEDREQEEAEKSVEDVEDSSEESDSDDESEEDSKDSKGSSNSKEPGQDLVDEGEETEEISMSEDSDDEDETSGPNTGLALRLRSKGPPDHSQSRSGSENE